MSTRLVPWRSRPREGDKLAIQNAQTASFRILRELGPTRFVLQENKSNAGPEVKSEDESSSVVTVSVGSRNECTCSKLLIGNAQPNKPLVLDGAVCVHTAFVLHHLFRVAWNNPLLYQAALIDREVDSLLAAREAWRAQRLASVAHSEEKACPITSTSSSDVGNIGRQPKKVKDMIDADGEATCSICYEDMTVDQETMGWLFACGMTENGQLSGGCGNLLHVKCLQAWLRHQSGHAGNTTCPLCRSPFAPNVDTVLASCAARATKAEQVKADLKRKRRDEAIQRLWKPVECCRCSTLITSQLPLLQCAACPTIALCPRCPPSDLPPCTRIAASQSPSHILLLRRPLPLSTPISSSSSPSLSTSSSSSHSSSSTSSQLLIHRSEGHTNHPLSPPHPSGPNLNRNSHPNLGFPSHHQHNHILSNEIITNSLNISPASAINIVSGPPATVTAQLMRLRRGSRGSTHHWQRSSHPHYTNDLLAVVGTPSSLSSSLPPSPAYSPSSSSSPSFSSIHSLSSPSDSHAFLSSPTLYSSVPPNNSDNIHSTPTQIRWSYVPTPSSIQPTLVCVSSPSSPPSTSFSSTLPSPLPQSLASQIALSLAIPLSVALTMRHLTKHAHYHPQSNHTVTHTPTTTTSLEPSPSQPLSSIQSISTSITFQCALCRTPVNTLNSPDPDSGPLICSDRKSIDEVVVPTPCGHVLHLQCFEKVMRSPKPLQYYDSLINTPGSTNKLLPDHAINATARCPHVSHISTPSAENDPAPTNSIAPSNNVMSKGSHSVMDPATLLCPGLTRRSRRRAVSAQSTLPPSNGSQSTSAMVTMIPSRHLHHILPRPSSWAAAAKATQEQNRDHIKQIQDNNAINPSLIATALNVATTTPTPNHLPSSSLKSKIRRGSAFKPQTHFLLPLEGKSHLLVPHSSSYSPLLSLPQPYTSSLEESPLPTHFSDSQSSAAPPSSSSSSSLSSPTPPVARPRASLSSNHRRASSPALHRAPRPPSLSVEPLSRMALAGVPLFGSTKGTVNVVHDGTPTHHIKEPSTHPIEIGVDDADDIDGGDDDAEWNDDNDVSGNNANNDNSDTNDDIKGHNRIDGDDSSDNDIVDMSMSTLRSLHTPLVHRINHSSPLSLAEVGEDVGCGEDQGTDEAVHEELHDCITPNRPAIISGNRDDFKMAIDRRLNHPIEGAEEHSDNDRLNSDLDIMNPLNQPITYEDEDLSRSADAPVVEVGEVSSFTPLSISHTFFRNAAQHTLSPDTSTPNHPPRSRGFNPQSPSSPLPLALGGYLHRSRPRLGSLSSHSKQRKPVNIHGSPPSPSASSSLNQGEIIVNGVVMTLTQLRSSSQLHHPSNTSVKPTSDRVQTDLYHLPKQRDRIRDVPKRQAHPSFPNLDTPGMGEHDRLQLSIGRGPREGIPVRLEMADGVIRKKGNLVKGLTISRNSLGLNSRQPSDDTMNLEVHGQ